MNILCLFFAATMTQTAAIKLLVGMGIKKTGGNSRDCFLRFFDDIKECERVRNISAVKIMGKLGN